MEDLVDQVLASRRTQRPQSGLKGGLIVAALLHAGALALVAWGAARTHPVPPKEYVAVQAVPLAALGVAKPKLPDASPLPKKPQEPPPEPEVPVQKPAPPLPKPEAPRPSPKAESSKPTKQPAAPDSGGSAAPTTAPPPPDQREGLAGGNRGADSPFGSTAIEGIDPDFTYDYYLDRMLGLIHSQWQRPPTEGEIRALLRFTVLKNGEIEALELLTPSGSNAFDLAALRAIRNAGPLPPLPASYRRGQLTVTLIVR